MTILHPPTPAPRPACLSLIAAVARNGGIGLNNQLLVYLPEDLKHFRRVTLGCPVIMGRMTWDSLPPQFRPLPGRRNLVISRNPQAVCNGAEVHTNFESALQALADVPKAFVIGGAQIYDLALPEADELVLTEIDADLAADAFFPAWKTDDFDQIERVQPSGGGADSPVAYSFATYRRRRS